MSCLFDSLSKFINISSNDLRQNIVQYLQTNPNLIEDVSFQEMLKWDNINHEQYLSVMSNEMSWGGAIEIKAFVMMYHINVKVHIPQQQKIVEFVKNTDHPFINIIWTGNHYIPIG